MPGTQIHKYLLDRKIKLKSRLFYLANKNKVSQLGTSNVTHPCSQVLPRCSATAYALQESLTGCLGSVFLSSISQDNAWYLPGIHSLLNLYFDKIVENVHCNMFSFRKKCQRVGDLYCQKTCLCSNTMSTLAGFVNDDMKIMNIKCQK